MREPDLEAVREWANAKLATGQEPPWAWYQYMKLRETLDAILGGQAVVMQQTENSPQAGSHPGMRLQLVDSTYRPDTAQPGPSDEPVQMPM